MAGGVVGVNGYQAGPATSTVAGKKKKAVVPAFQGTPEVNAALQETNQTPEAIALQANPAFLQGPPAAQISTAGSQLTSATNSGTQNLRADLERRQGAPNPYADQLDLSGQFGGGPAPATAKQNILANMPNVTGPIWGEDGNGGAAIQSPLMADPRIAGAPGAARITGGPLVGRLPPPPAAPSKTDTAATQAEQALGPAPTIDMGLADRGKGTVDQALGLSQQVVDSALQPVDQASLTAATADARNVLDKLLNGPSTADRIGAQTLKSQLALARSAAGGPGAVQEALRNAQNAAPELQAQATQSAVQEQLQRQQAAGAITGQLQGSALGEQQNVTGRIGTAADAASGFAQGALGSKAQDIQIATANQGAASNLLNSVAQLTGTQLELDQRNQELIGQMARDAEATKFNWGQLDAQTQDAEFARWVQVYGIDKAAAAQIAAAAKASEKSVWDYIIPIIGAGATIGAAAVAGPAAPAVVAGAAGIPSIAGGR